MTLNLIRQSNATPTVSAYAHLSGPFDYNKMPLAPMGCNLQVHEKADSRGTWAYHTVEGWYINTSPDHYRTHICQIKNTRSERLSDTVDFKHKRITNPSITNADKVMLAIQEVVKTIKGKGGQSASAEAYDLQTLVDGARHYLNESPNNRTSASTTSICSQPVPRVDQHSRCVTRSQHHEARRHDDDEVQFDNNQPAPRVSKRQRLHKRTAPTSKRRAERFKRRLDMIKGPPARRTWSKTVKAAMTAQLTMTTRQRATLLTIPLCTRQQKGSALAVATKQNDRATFQQLNQRIAKMENEVMEAMAVMDTETGKLMNYRQLMQSEKHKEVWSISSANEFGGLANGVGGQLKGTNTIKFIRKHDVPHERRKDATYGQFVCSIRPEKAEQHRTRFTVGGDRVNYPGEVATPTAEMLVAKILFNSVISTLKAKFMTINISNFYLMTPLKWPEFIRMKLSNIPEEIIAEYKLRAIVTQDGLIYIQANKGMYGLPQSGLLANELFEQRLNTHGYRQSKLVPGLWKHDT
jgi:hypothetical protein